IQSAVKERYLRQVGQLQRGFSTSLAGGLGQSGQGSSGEQGGQCPNLFYRTGCQTASLERNGSEPGAHSDSSNKQIGLMDLRSLTCLGTVFPKPLPHELRPSMEKGKNDKPQKSRLPAHRA